MAHGFLSKSWLLLLLLMRRPKSVGLVDELSDTLPELRWTTLPGTSVTSGHEELNREPAYSEPTHMPSIASWTCILAGASAAAEWSSHGAHHRPSLPI